MRHDEGLVLVLQTFVRNSDLDRIPKPLHFHISTFTSLKPRRLVVLALSLQKLSKVVDRGDGILVAVAEAFTARL